MESKATVLSSECRLRPKEVALIVPALKVIAENPIFEDAAKAIHGTCRDLVGAKSGFVALLSQDQCLNELVYLDSDGLPCTVDPSPPVPIRGPREEVYRTGTLVF